MIVTTARAGSHRHAWDLFVGGGHAARADDPAALAVKGRLLKDRAIGLPASEQPAAFAEAAAAYAGADALAPQAWTRINCATLTLLAGDVPRAQAEARELLAWLAGADDIAETPYYLAATRAEAHLLLGDVAAAERALAEAVAANPEGWEDQASTLRQFALIATQGGFDTAWLDAYRPPRALHYAGHLGVAAQGSEALGRQVAELIAQEHVGAGFGALAAGADIVIAETLLAHGAELNVILPDSLDNFIAQSVAPFGEEWLPRFDACLEAAATVRCLTQLGGGFQPLGSQLAASVAMGAAMLHARRFETRAVQVIIIDEGAGPFGNGRESARSARTWQGAGLASHVLRWPRNASVLASGARTEPEGRADLRLAALLHVGFDGMDALDDAGFARAVDTVLAPLRGALRDLAVQPDRVLPAGNGRIAAFSDPQAAWAWARALLALPPGPMPLRLAGHYGIAHWLEEPPALVGRALAELEQIARVAMPGVLTVSETFADALQLVTAAPPHVEQIGEIGTMALFAVSA
jgi:hypothetical protein